MTVIEKISFDGIENMDLYSAVKDEQNSSIPTSKVLGKKVCEDSSVSKIIYIYTINLSIHINDVTY